MNLDGYLFSPLFESLRIVFGLMMVLFWPGYCLQACLFPQRGELEVWERVVLSFGLSTGVAAVIAPLLDRSPWGLHLWPVVIAYVAFILMCSGIRAYGPKWAPETEHHGATVKFNVLSSWRHLDASLRKTYVAQAVAVLSGAGVLFANTILLHPGEKYTEFYILGVDGLAQDFIREVELGQRAEVRCVIANHEGTTAVYWIEVRQQGNLIGGRGQFVLQDGEVVEAALRFVPVKKGEKLKFEFLLMREDVERPYRSLVLWMDVTD